MALLNDRFVRACAGDFAKRLVAICNEDDEQLVQTSFEFAFSRPASGSELESSVAFIRSQSQARQQRGETDFRVEAVTDYCQSLFGLNEFIYVD